MRESVCGQAEDSRGHGRASSRGAPGGSRCPAHGERGHGERQPNKRRARERQPNEAGPCRRAAGTRQEARGRRERDPVRHGGHQDHHATRGGQEAGSSGRPAGRTPGRVAADESGCTPGSVPEGPRGPSGDGHPSRAGVATGLQRSTRGLGRAALDRPRRGTGVPPLDLAPGGVYLAAQVALGTGGLLHHRFTLTGGRSLRRSAFCGTVPRVTPGGR